MKRYLAGLLCTISVFAISCSHLEKADSLNEPVDPDCYNLTVWEDVTAGINSGFGSLDVAYSKSIPPKGKISESIELQGWKGERVNCKLLVWSSETEENISIQLGKLKSGKNTINEEAISVSVVQYVLTDQFLNENGGACGPRDNDKTPVHLVPDILSDKSSFMIENQGTRPVWISIDIPSDAPAGLYTGKISIKSKSGKVNHSIALEVLNYELPPPSNWVFHLDLWQNPFAVARYHDVELWSPEHMDLLKSYLTILAEAGQKCITTTINDRPWGWEKPCYDDFRSMIDWTQKIDGSWEYDYQIFDSYVNLAMECGISKQINCYTMVPIRNDFVWYDEVLSDTIVKKLYPGTAEYEAFWRPFLADFSQHLKTNGWLKKTTIALDEREEEEMTNMFKFIADAAPEFKITMAGFYHESINLDIYDFSSNWRDYGRIPGEAIKKRKDAGLITTYYVACGIPKPNNFTFSPPPEGCFEGWIASAMGFDGFLRWAYNSWPIDPMMDSRYIKWPAGDTYFIYPGPRSSIRFERLREGIQDYEKIRIVKNKLKAGKLAESDAALQKLENFLQGIDAKTLDSESAADVINKGKSLLNEIVKSTV